LDEETTSEHGTVNTSEFILHRYFAPISGDGSRSSLQPFCCFSKMFLYIVVKLVKIFKKIYDVPSLRIIFNGQKIKKQRLHANVNQEGSISLATISRRKSTRVILEIYPTMMYICI